MSGDASKALIQESQYEFPYHYLPHFDDSGRPLRMRHLRWGFEYLCYQLHIKALVEAMNPRSVIEVGCGDGYLIGSLTPKFRRVGVDLSERAIRFAKAFHPHAEYAAVDARSVKEQFDVVLAVEVLEHIPNEDIDEFVRTLKSLVAPGGVLLISVPSDVVPVHPKHHRHYSQHLLKAQVSGMDGEFVVERTDHVYAPPAWLEPFAKLTCNRYLALELPAVNALIWRRIWRSRLATPESGRHVVGVFRRMDRG
ncbi:MAG: class I SAM-dependent methyltransferase [Steroidobacter sp.]